MKTMKQKHPTHSFRLIAILFLQLILCIWVHCALGFSTPGGFVTSTHHHHHHDHRQHINNSNRPACINKREPPQLFHGSRSRLSHKPTEHTSTTTLNLQYVPSLHLDITPVEAETLAGPFFGLSLFPYLAFLYFLNVPENDTPKGVTVGFAACLVFVFLTIPAAIAAQVLYGVSLADSDWLHGSAESLLTMTNLVTVVAFRQALRGKEREYIWNNNNKNYNNNNRNDKPSPGVVFEEENTMPLSATSYQPMTILVGVLTLLAGLTALIPAAIWSPEVHTPYLGGFMDVSRDWVTFGHPEPPNALSIACWIIHISSLVEFLVAMGFAWRWADVVGNPKWKGLTWGLLPLHSSGITACTYHLFYNHIPILVALQAVLTCFGNTTAAYAAWRIAVSNGWRVPSDSPLSFLNYKDNDFTTTSTTSSSSLVEVDNEEMNKENEGVSVSFLVGFEDIGDALANDNDYTFLLKLFVGCGIAAYVIKYGELLVDFPFVANPYMGLAFVFVPSALNAFKWYKRSQDPSFEGWF
mmetsp:Transcript_8806/g.16626  ORF Transcript_8806/g.16626 Transcript_8806/m.16626 type:complete len:524 (-) Transcript_8806:2465-4036(-)